MGVYSWGEKKRFEGGLQMLEKILTKWGRSALTRAYVNKSDSCNVMTESLDESRRVQVGALPLVFFNFGTRSHSQTLLNP